MTRAAIYTRVSTDMQTCDNQQQALRATAAAKDWTVVAEFQDAGISGAKDRNGRPGLDAMLTAAAAHEFDVLMCWSIDRLGRSLINLLDIAELLRKSSVQLFFLAQSIDTTTPAGHMFFQITGAFAEYERRMIADRIRAGLARRRAEGKHVGKAPHGPEMEARIRSHIQTQGHGIVRTARALGVGNGVVTRVMRAMKATTEGPPP